MKQVVAVMLTALVLLSSQVTTWGQASDRRRPGVRGPRQNRPPTNQLDELKAIPVTERGADRIRLLYHWAVPTDDQMGFYQLDWAKDLADATSRAKREGRPILFIGINNHSGPNEFFSGHC